MIDKLLIIFQLHCILNYLFYSSTVKKEGEVEVTSVKFEGHIDLSNEDEVESQGVTSQRDFKQLQEEFQGRREEQKDHYSKPPRIDFDADRSK